jgi:cupin fold WbuC family metalloprotein
MIKVNSKVNSKLLHMVYRAEDFKESRTELVEPDQFIQCAYLKMDAGKTFRPHKHIWKVPSFDRVIAQESWVVIKGQVKALFYDTDGAFLESHILNEGDSSFTLEGGHTYEIMQDDTLVYEYKTGPYNGQHLDKRFLDDQQP